VTSLNQAAAEARDELVPTSVGTARLDWFPAPAQPRAVALLGHGTATGVEAADLQALAAVLPQHGITVALVTQPYRVEGNPAAATPSAAPPSSRPSRHRSNSSRSPVPTTCSRPVPRASLP
jgi:hypothetical protein